MTSPPSAFIGQNDGHDPHNTIEGSETSEPESRSPTRQQFCFSIPYDDDFYCFRYKGIAVPQPWNLPIKSGDIERFEALEGDICSASYPKSGSQWMAAIVLMITNNADPQCLHSGKPLRETVPFIEQVIPSQMAKPELWNINRLAGMPSPRLYSTHLPADGFPQSIWQKAQMIYMYRNPKDVAVLMHHWLRGLEAVQYNHEIPYFVEQLTDGLPKRPAWYGPLL
ncbi:hypothetical protein RvY_04007-1 [Ramazzottius varieornatus]|uniref:Sulfotransferase domain-containing protein n=1 Tax=Ramazzottius varieornatus TaxID=947166 RepID=A0A1D1UTM5_RAMVA|nr:hypothetical protein RvY_04007-1 [Ramazzottius varieornatus]